MTITLRPLRPTFAGEISGLDLRSPMSTADVAAIDAGMDRYGVLVFRDQPISDDQQMTFTRNFGQIEGAQGGNITKDDEYRLQEGMIDVSNLDKRGQPLERNDRRRMFNLGNRLWHSDSSYRAIPAKYSLLSARVVAASGGNTEFADMRAAYDALDDDMRTTIEDLVCEHSLMYSRGSMGFTEFTDAERAMFKPVRQRLVRTHPVTKRRALFVNGHFTTHIDGLPRDEGRAILKFLCEHNTREEFQVRFSWKPHSVAFWDNRCVQHQALWDYYPQTRSGRRVTIRGDRPV